MKPQKITAKRQHGLKHHLLQNDELAFSSNEPAFLPRLIFKYQTTEFVIDLEASVNCQNLQRYKFSDEGFSATKKHGWRTTNHSQLA